MRNWAISALCVFIVSAGAYAKTPDRKPPSAETVCDNEHGAAFGLCNAYCEAQDCGDPRQRSNNKACENLRMHFERMTGRPMPCEVTCPCGDLIQLFANIDNGSVKVEQCFITPERVTVVTDRGEYAVVENAVCDANDQPPFVQLNDTERLACRIRLRNAAESHGVVCQSPE